MVRQRVGIQDRAFPAEFADFIGFVGPDLIDNAVRRVDTKLKTLSGSARTLYGERFFLHHQITLFTEQSFQLDVNDFFAVRAATLMAVTNFVRKQLSDRGTKHLRSMIIDNLKPDRDVRQIEHELRCYTHISQLDLDVDFSDLEKAGGGKNFDLIVNASSGEYEVERKTINHDAGSQFKQELNVNLVAAFEKGIKKQKDERNSGLFILKLHRPTSECTHLSERFKRVIEAETLPYECEDFSLTFEDRPEWQSAANSQEIASLKQRVMAEFGDDPHFATMLGARPLAIVFRPHAPGTLAENVVELIHKASRQCSGTRPCVIWVHFIGLSQSAFEEIARNSITGGGLNAIVSRGIFEDAPPEGRNHIERVRFTADSNQLIGKKAVGPDGQLHDAVSVDGITYDVPNPRCVFPPIQKV
jgi:hypothetical protein